jgi:hypothetical protein
MSHRSFWAETRRSDAGASPRTQECRVELHVVGHVEQRRHIAGVHRIAGDVGASICLATPRRRRFASAVTWRSRGSMPGSSPPGECQASDRRGTGEGDSASLPAPRSSCPTLAQADRKPATSHERAAGWGSRSSPGENGVGPFPGCRTAWPASRTLASVGLRGARAVAESSTGRRAMLAHATCAELA